MKQNSLYRQNDKEMKYTEKSESLLNLLLYRK